MSKCIIGVDIGTTSTKAVVFDTDGKVLAHHAVGYPLLTPSPAAAEQDPDEIYARGADRFGKSVRKAQTAPDRGDRRGLQRRHAQRDCGGRGRPAAHPQHHLGGQSGNRTGPSASKTTGTGWRFISAPARRSTPCHRWPSWSGCGASNRRCLPAARFIGIKEYVFFRLFKRYVVDYSIASATGLFNLTQLDWDTEALELAGSLRSVIRAVPTTFHLAGLEPELAQGTWAIAEHAVRGRRQRRRAVQSGRQRHWAG
jgi:gluconokinase